MIPEGYLHLAAQGQQFLAVRQPRASQLLCVQNPRMPMLETIHRWMC